MRRSTDSFETGYALYADHYPKEKEGSRGVWASQLLRCVKEVEVGDPAVVGDPERRRYILGTVNSDYEELAWCEVPTA